MIGSTVMKELIHCAKSQRMLENTDQKKLCIRKTFHAMILSDLYLLTTGKTKQLVFSFVKI